MLDEDVDNVDDDVLLLTPATATVWRRGISENMFTNASSSVFITNLTHRHDRNI